MTDIIHQDGELDGVDEGDLEGLAGTDIPVFPSSDRSLAELERLYKEGTLKLDADWQRGYVWTSKRASRLIESFLIGLPIPVIYLAEDDNYEYEVIDGMQRLTSVFSFLNNDLKLTGLEIMADLNGCHFKDLQKPLQNKLRNSPLRTIVCPQTSDKNLKYLMFERLNTGGVALNEMEIRNCLYRGKLNDLIKELVQFKEFKECMAQKNIHRRMKDRTLVLRFLAFYQMTYSKARKGLKAFFNEFFETYRDPSQEKLNEFSSKFKCAMKAAFTIFGNRGFKLNSTSRSVNASIFQVICVSFTDYDQGALTRSADAIYTAYLDLIETDLRWVNCVSTSTSTYNRISYTFETWNKKLKQVMENAEPNDSKRLFPRELKEDLYSQSKVCEICGQQITHIDDAALDHDKQHWQGGKTVPENARLVHQHCNATRPRSEVPSNEPQSLPDAPQKRLTAREQLYVDYWTAFKKHLEQHNGVIKPVAAHKYNAVRFGVGRTGFRLEASTSVREKWICVSLGLFDEHAKPYYHLLERDKVNIEQAIGSELEWTEKPDGKESHINLSLLDTDPQDHENWNRQHKWLCEQLETFHRVFSPRFQLLNANDYQPETEEIS